MNCATTNLLKMENGRSTSILTRRTYFREGGTSSVFAPGFVTHRSIKEKRLDSVIAAQPATQSDKL